MPDEKPKLEWDYLLDESHNHGTDGLGIIARHGMTKSVDSGNSCENVLEVGFWIFLDDEISGEERTKLCQEVADLIRERVL